jgi:G:T/U-mismatch repair DNA glycosylase
MGGPIIEASAARCLANAAREADYAAIAADQPDGEEGIFVKCHDRPCIPAVENERRQLRGESRVLCGKIGK